MTEKQKTKSILNPLAELINKTNPLTPTDFFGLFNRITAKKIKAKNEPSIKIAILSSFTIAGLEKILFVKSCQIGILPEIYMGGYDQIFQEIIDKNSKLYAFNPDAVILFFDTRSIFGELYYIPNNLNPDKIKKYVSEKIKEVSSLIEHAKKNTGAKIIIHNLEVPYRTGNGPSEDKQDFGLIEAVQTFNSEIRKLFKNDNQVIVFDYESFCSRFGKQNLLNEKYYYAGDIRLDIKYYPNLSDEYVGYLIPLKSKTKKCLVLDLDNTLWGGVVGEDGINGIKLGPTPEGRPYLELQKYILSLHKRGIILAINSKNNQSDVKEIFKKHPYMILKEKHFASMKINWGDKISNMQSIKNDLNIGMDSLVFVDDDELNREMIKKSLPEIEVINMPKDPSLYLKTIMDLKCFNVLNITEEDTKKGEIYYEQNKRKELQNKFSNIDDFIKNLKMSVTIEKINELNLPRLAQLTQKTNQFNLTTKRYLEEDLLRLEKQNHSIFSIQVKDKFGDSGIVGLYIIKNDGKKTLIDTFLLSCRVIGREIEKAMFQHIYKLSKKHGQKEIIGTFIPTLKNSPAKDFFKNNGFILFEKKDKEERWKYDLNNQYKMSNLFTIIIK